MKKIVVFLLPFLIAIVVFIVIALLLGKNKNKGALQITANPNARVYLNNQFIGQTPLCKCELKEMFAPGDYDLKLVPVTGNSEPFNQKITIFSKVLTVIDRTFGSQAQAEASVITLVALESKKDAQISVITFPDKTQVFLDSNLVGSSPVLLKNITESDHEIKLTRDGYKDKILRVRAVLGYKLDALVALGINPQVATSSAMVIASDSASLSVSKVKILNTPTGFLRVRDEASIKGKEIDQLTPGQTYPLLEEQTDWFKIKIDEKKEGWISASYAQKQ